MITLPPKIALAAVGLGAAGGLGGWGVYEVAGGGIITKWAKNTV